MDPIHNAAYDGNVEEVRRLVQQDPGVVHIYDANGYTPLHLAIEKGHVGVVAWLLGHWAHFNEQSFDECTACYLACCVGHLSVVELLLGEGADPSIPSHNGVTPLMAASREGHAGVVRCLLHHPQAMTTLSHRSNVGWTALYWACCKDNGGVVRLLLEAGADPTLANSAGETPVEVARRRGHDVCVELLEESERHYLLTKARHLRDASHDDDVTQALAHQPSSSSSTAKRARTKATPTYLMGRVEKGKPLPTAEVMGDGGEGEGDKSVREVEEGLLVAVVLEHVVCGGLKGELFVELMEVMGRTGYRKDRKNKEGGNAAAAAQQQKESDSDDDDDGNAEEEEGDDDDGDDEEEEEEEG